MDSEEQKQWEECQGRGLLRFILSRNSLYCAISVFVSYAVVSFFFGSLNLIDTTVKALCFCLAFRFCFWQYYKRKFNAGKKAEIGSV